MQPGGSRVSKRCPQCQRDRLVFTSHYPVLNTTIALTITAPGTDDGRERLRYQAAWVCRNMNCDYRELIDQ